MASAAQIQANRLNSLRSTGPASSAGKAASRFNAVKSGIYAKQLALPGEDLAELESMAANYQQQLRPFSQIEQFLVDSLIESDWRLRRLRKAETELWAANPDPAAAFENLGLARLYRLIATTRRFYSQSLKELMYELAVTEPARSAPEPLGQPLSHADELAQPSSRVDSALGCSQAEVRNAPMSAHPLPSTPRPELASFRQQSAAAPITAPRSVSQPQIPAVAEPHEEKAAPKINLALRL
jgi:hypothetical protein